MFLANTNILITFENLENVFNFLKLIINGFVFILPEVIHGCFEI